MNVFALIIAAFGGFAFGLYVGFVLWDLRIRDKQLKYAKLANDLTRQLSDEKAWSHRYWLQDYQRRIQIRQLARACERKNAIIKKLRAERPDIPDAQADGGVVKTK